MKNQDNPLFFPAYEADYQYLDNLHTALSNTASLGLPVPQFTIDSSFTPDLEALYERVEDIVYIESHDPKNHNKPPAAHCFLYAQWVWEGLQKFYKRPLLLTSGYMLIEKRKVFYEPLAALAARLDTQSDKKINLHVWVTLPDLTIVDPTLIYSLRQARPIDNLLTEDIFIRNARDQNNQEEFCYQPVLVGREYWDKGNANIIP